MIDILQISLQFGAKYLYRDVSFKINSGDKIALVGANGTGKTSLLRLITGQLSPESGKIQKAKSATIGYLPQENIVHKGKSLIDEVSSALTDITFLRDKEDEISDALNKKGISDEERDDLINQLGEVHHRLEDLDSFSSEAKVKKIIMGLGFKEKEFEKPTVQFSGGWQMRIALAKILISQNDILLLDEPTNHLDLDSLKWLTKFLKSYKGAILTVSHDKSFINEITNKTLELFAGKFYLFNGTYNAYLNYKTERDQLNINLAEQQVKKIKETEKFIERFRYKSSKAKQVQSRIKQLEKIEKIELPETEKSISIKFPEVQKSGKTVAELKSISKSFDDLLVFKNIDLQINRGDKIAFVGPNGAGKTTLSKIIAGKLAPTSGINEKGYNVFTSYYSQDVADEMNKDMTIIETLENMGSELTQNQLRTLLGSFLFGGDDIYKKISVLSGGEKSRVALAKILLTKSNFIILDEPTNHLDISSSQLLQSALINFSGSLVIVSHDVDFLRPIANKVLDIRDERANLYEGDIDYYIWKKEEELNNKNSFEKRFKKNKPGNTQSKKELKRIEAENRRLRFQATKDLTSEIKNLENRISELETKETGLEKKLLDSNLYNDQEISIKINLEYNKTKEELKKLLSVWEDKQEELNEIESKFS
ncbi:MAG TPA: ABC transporter ATP-binding protein [Ignavibacteria bacterium]|nr:ABC transporter ATP-binding protein [Ignavibacteria bacterium]